MGKGVIGQAGSTQWGKEDRWGRYLGELARGGEWVAAVFLFCFVFGKPDALFVCLFNSCYLVPGIFKKADGVFTCRIHSNESVSHLP